MKLVEHSGQAVITTSCCATVGVKLVEQACGT